jgi:predicted small lipoprotein YifL
MKNATRFPAALLLSMFLLGCGQTGPLYVSGNPGPAEPSTSQTGNDKEDEQDAESSDQE